MLAKESGKPYIVLRKEYKPYMGGFNGDDTINRKVQRLYLDEKIADWQGNGLFCLTMSSVPPNPAGYAHDHG